jgi:sulfate adenylyltransferase
MPVHGGGHELVDLLLQGEALAALKEEATQLPNLLLSDRQLCDIELLLNGGFTPLRGFMNQADYERVVNEMRLANGILWPMPITLDVSEQTAETLSVGKRVALRDAEGNLIAVLQIESIYRPDKLQEAQKVFGTTDTLHPGVDYLLRKAGPVYVGGSLQGAQLPVHYDFTDLRLTPRETREAFKRQGWLRVVGFQTRNPMHRSHLQLTLFAARDAKANVFVHPVVGMTKPGDVDHYTRVRCYKELIKHYPSGMAMLSLNPLAMRMGGPREAVWHAIVRKNYGCTHFIIGRDHAGPGKDSKGQDFYAPYAAQQLVSSVEAELGIGILKYSQVVYVEERAEYMQDTEVPQGMRTLSISGTELRRRLFRGLPIPDWFTFPEVVRILRQTHPARKDQGFCVFFTGLSGSGKSTIANALRILLLEDGRRPVSLLDGEKLRQNLSSELTFSKEHRDLNVHRVAYVASTIAKGKGVAIMAMIAPYREQRRRARELVEQAGGGFVEVYVSTPLEVCEARDRSGVYAKARRGEIKNFTGVDDPYEPPEKPDITIDASRVTVRQAVHEIVLYLEQEGYLATQ